MVSIDVNSGKSSGEKGVEDTAFKTNLEAAAEVARHLRLRDLGGLVVIDFIDMRDNKHNKEVERALKDALKMDKARVNLGRISQFGMMEMSRQRIAKNINDAIHLECPHCEGRGRVKSVEAMAVSFLRKVHAAAAKGQIAEVRGGLPLEVAYFLLNRKKRELAQIENDYEIVVTIKGKPSFLLNQLELETVRKEKQREELPELDLRLQAPAIDVSESVMTTPEAEEGEVVVDPAAKKRRKRKRKKRSADRPVDAATAEQADDVVESSVIDDSVTSAVEEVVSEQSADHQEPVAKKRRRSRSRKKPAVTIDGETETSTEAPADTVPASVTEPVLVPAAEAAVPPVRPARPKRAAKKATVAVVEAVVVGDLAVQAPESVAVKPAARKRTSSARKKTVQEPAADGGEPVEPVAAPKARKRPASRSKKSVTVVADEVKE